MYLTISDRFYIPNLMHFLRLYIKGCHICQLNRKDKLPERQLGIKIKTVAPYNHQSLQAEHGIKSLSVILTKHLTKSGDMWIDYLPFATLAHNTFNSPNLSNYSPYELVFGRKPESLLDLETDPDIKVSATYKEYYNRLEQRLKYLQKVLLDFKMRHMALLNKEREYFQYNSRD